MTTLKQQPFAEVCSIIYRYKITFHFYCGGYLDAKESFEVSQGELRGFPFA